MYLTENDYTVGIPVKFLELQDIRFTAANRKILAGLTLAIEAGEVYASHGDAYGSLTCP